MARLFQSGSGLRNHQRSTPRGRTKNRTQQLRAVLERLEERTLLAYSTFPGSYVVNGAFVGTVTIIGNNASDALVITNDGSGFLSHTGDGNTGPGAGQFASDLDWDSTTAGVQPLAADPGTALSFQFGGGLLSTHSVTLGSAAQPASAFQGTNFKNPPGALIGTRSIIIDDATGTAPGPYTVDTDLGPDFPVTGPNFSLAVNGIANGGITVRGGTGGHIFNVLSTFKDEPIKLFGSTGVDEFNVHGNGGKVDIDGQGGDDFADVGDNGSVQDVKGPLEITNPGGTIDLGIDDSADPVGQTATLTATTLSSLAPAPISFANLTFLDILGGTGDDTFNVQGTPAGALTTISCGVGSDTANLGNAGSMQGIVGTLDFFGEILNADDSADTVPRSVTINSDFFGGLAPAPVNYTDDLKLLTIRGGSGGNSFHVANTLPAGSASVLNTGSNDDAVALDATSGGDLTIDLEGGEDELVVHGAGLSTTGTHDFDGGPGVNTLVVRAEGPSSPANLTVPGQVTFANGAKFSYVNFNSINVVEDNQPPVIVATPAITATRGIVLQNFVVGTFTDPDLIENASSYLATIAWGDGSLPTAGVVTEDPSTPGRYFISGTHAYSGNGPFAIVVTVIDLGGTFVRSVGGVPVITTLAELPAVTGPGATVAITDQPISAQGANIGAGRNSPFSGTIATFQDASGADVPANYLVLVKWGDGTAPVPVPTADIIPFGNTFIVNGNHTYKNSGSFLVTVSIEHILSAGPPVVHGGTGIALGNASVSAGALVPLTTNSVNYSTGSPSPSNPLATFTDAGGAQPLDQYSARIDWGDGTALTGGTFTVDAGVFTVSGSHNYAAPGTYNGRIEIFTNDGSILVLPLTSTVVNPAITFAPGIAPLAGTPTGTLTVATIAPGALAPPLNATFYTAVVDWGDGTGVVNAWFNPALLAIRSNGHTYGLAGSHTITVTLFDSQGVQVGVAFDAITVSGFTGTLNVRKPVVGTPSGAENIVTFTAPINPSVASYSAIVDYGDGSTPVAGVVAGSGTNLTVGVSGHNFAEAGDYTVTVTLRGSDGNVVGTVSDTRTVLTPSIAPADLVFTVPGTPTGPFALVTVSVPVTATNGPLDRGFYTATIDFGDGTPTVAGELVPAPILGASRFRVTTSGHTYVAQGNFTVTTTIRDSQGVVVGSSTSVSHSRGLPIVPVPLSVTEGQTLNNVLIATVTPPFPIVPPGTVTVIVNPKANFYTATVDWGDGTRQSIGHVNQSKNVFTLEISASHTYKVSGNHTVIVTLGTTGNPQVSVGSFVINVKPAPFSLSGRLDPRSDTGLSNSDGITKIVTPTFTGNATPFSIIRVYATPSGSGIIPGTPIATATTNSAGVWAATVQNKPLAQGTYNVSATASDGAGNVRAAATLGKVVIDTAGPRITALTFDRFSGKMTITYQDNLSGLNQSGLRDGANYRFSGAQLSRKVPVPNPILVSSITVSPAGTRTSPQTATLIFNGGRALRGGAYTIVVLSGGRSGIQDVAGNALDGEFYGTFPSGNGQPGGNFSALINSFHNVILSPLPVPNGFANPSTGATATIVKTTVTHAASPTPAAAKVKPKIVHDTALAALVAAKKP